MIVTCLSWIYIAFFCLAVGIVLRNILGHVFVMEREPGNISVTSTIVLGIVGITVYAEIFSVFYKVGAICHLLLLCSTLLCIVFSRWVRSLFLTILSKIRSLLCSWEGPVLILITLIAAFFTSRGTFHTDTNIYHAQAIRLIEEYGCVKGLANLQLHYGYNSSYLVFCAFFTMRWLTGTALHTTTGFLIALFGIYACHKLKDIRVHLCHGGDAMRFALLIYILTNLTGAMSPATDYGTGYLLLYLFCAYFDIAEKEYPDTKTAQEQKLSSYGFLSVYALFLVSMKLSAAATFLIVLYPLSYFLKRKRWKTIAAFACLGVIIFLPYLIRNVILTGWLFYPFEAIDLFSFEWKVPVEYSLVDSGQIKAWARCLYDIALLDLPITEWIPIWWEEKQHYEEMLLIADALSLPIYICDLFLIHANKKSGIRSISYRPDVILFTGMLYASCALWFFTAPFIRYGLPALLALPFLSVGLFAENYAIMRKKALDEAKSSSGYSSSIWMIPGGFLSILTTLCFCAWIDNYLTDALVFVKQNITQPYYITQKPFDEAEMASETMGEDTLIYYSGDGTLNSYYEYPSTCYYFMLERTEMIGDTVEEGFRAK